jgi:EmrB/QacA subfamily drug resistance transporter
MEAVPAAPDTAASQQVVQIDPRTRNRILFAILVGLFLSALDQTIVGTALPQIVTDLSGNELYTWVVTVYLLTSTITGPIYGKLSDQFGRKLLLLFGIGLFLFGSFLCGLSQNMPQLILFRGIQGLGAGALFPISLAVIGDLFSPKERGKYQGLFGAVFGVSALIGPALGGFLTDQVSWHWVFWVNLPLGAVAMYIIWRLLPAHTESGVTRSIDYLGVAVFTLAVVPILIGLTNTQNPALSWADPWVGGLIVLGLILTGVFIWVESRAKEPIVPLGLFRNRTYSVSILAGALASFGFFGAILFLPRWYQVVNGSTATESGYQLLPLLAGLILGSVVSGQIVSRTGRYKWLVVSALVTLTIGLLLMTNLNADTPPQMLWVWQFITGLGIGPTLAVFTIIVQNAVPWQLLGAATSNLAFFRQIGGTVGLAIAGSIFGSTLQTQAPTQVAGALTAAGAPPEMVAQLGGSLAGGGFTLDDLSAVGDMGARILETIRVDAGDQIAALVQPFIPAIVAGIHEAFSLAIANTMWISAAAAAIAVLASLALREAPLRTSVHEGSMAARRPTPEVAAAD